MPEPRPSRSRLYATIASACVGVVLLSFGVAALRSDGGDEVALAPTAQEGAVQAVDGFGEKVAEDNDGATALRTAAPEVSLAPVSGSVTWPSGANTGVQLAEEQKAFGEWRGRPLTSALYFADQSSWEGMQAAGFVSGQSFFLPDALTVISYAPWPIDETGGSLAECATGAYDAEWKVVAQNLVEGDLQDAVIRLGWEFNGNWYRWSAVGDQGARDFAGCYRKIVTAMRTASGQEFRFSWSPVQTKAGLDLELAYPGDAFVDDIGFDVYNDLKERGATPQEQWDLLLNIKYGLKWQLAFARQHKKDIAYPEWGGFTTAGDLSSGDDALFVRNMYAWMQQHEPAYENYFNQDNLANRTYYGLTTTTSVMPRSAEAYKDYWGRS